MATAVRRTRTQGMRLQDRGPVTLLREMLRIRLAKFAFLIIAVTVLAALFAPLLPLHDPTAINPEKSLSVPTARYWLGADRLGRDQLSRIIYGARESLRIATGGVGIAVVVGIAVGTVAAYFGRMVDEVLMRIMDALAAFPPLVLALSLVAVIGGDWQNVVIAIGITMTPWIARLIRGQVLSVKERDYVTAALATGASPTRIILRHLIPNSLGPVIVAATMGLGLAIILEASLSFLGVGVKPPTPTWGGMLSRAFETIEQAPWLAFAPGAVIFLVVLAFNLAGDALRDVLDPRLRHERSS